MRLDNYPYGSFPKLGGPFWGVLVIRSLLLGASIGVPDFGELLYELGSLSIYLKHMMLQIDQIRKMSDQNIGNYDIGCSPMRALTRDAGVTGPR